MVGKLLESLTSDPSINVEVNIETALSPILESKTKEELMLKSIENAKSKAELIAKALHVTLNNIQTIDQLKRSNFESSQAEGYLHSELTYENNWTMSSLAEIEVSESIHIVWTITASKQ